MHHMHLIVKAENMGNVGPCRLRRRRLASQSRFKTGDPSIELRRDPDLVPEPALELTYPDPRAASDIRHANASAAREDLRRGPGHAVTGVAYGTLHAQVLVCDPDPVVKRGDITKLAFEFAEPAAER